MCRGVKYQLSIRKPRCEEFDVYDDMLMYEAVNKIKQKLDEYYCLSDLKVTKHILYNLLNRPQNCNKFIKRFVTFTKQDNSP